MSISEKLSRFDFEIYEIGHQSVSLSIETSTPTEKIINSKYNIYVKSNI
jgi:hypothetical protein